MCMTDKGCENSVFIRISREGLGRAVHSQVPLPSHFEGSSPSPSGPVNTIFSILHKKLGLVKKLVKGTESAVHTAAIVHNWLVGDETQAHKNGLFSPDLSLAVYFLFPRKKLLLSAFSPQGDLGGDEENLEGGPASHHQRRVRHRLPAVVGAL